MRGAYRYLQISLLEENSGSITVVVQAEDAANSQMSCALLNY